VVKAKQ